MPQLDSSSIGSVSITPCNIYIYNKYIIYSTLQNIKTPTHCSGAPAVGVTGDEGTRINNLVRMQSAAHTLLTCVIHFI